MIINKNMPFKNEEESGIKGDGIHKITVSAVAPSNPKVGDLWIDTS